jgi:putative inorganic carbon (HCO3(-)) transporter
VSRIPQLIRGLPGAEGGIHPNELGGTLTFFVPMSLAVFLMPGGGSRGRTWVRRAAGLMLTLFFVAVLLLTQSRSAWAGSLAGLAAMAAARWRWARWLLLALAVLLALGFLYLGPEVAALAFLPAPLPAGGEILLDGASLAERLQPWRQGLDALTQYPLTGVGLGAFRAIAPRFGPWPGKGPDPENSHAHNVFLQTGLDLGLPGLVAYAALIGIALWICLALIRRNSGPHRWLALGLLGSVVAFHVFGLADAIALGAKPGAALWMLLALAAALWNTRGDPRVPAPGASP